MARPRHRSTHSQFLLFAASTTLGWRSTRRISYARGEAMVAKGKFRRVVDDIGQLVGYQPVVVAEPSMPSQDTSRCALAEPETKANAGLFGASRTAGMTPEERATRVHPRSGRLMPEADFIERVKELVKQYPESANFRDIRTKRKGLAPGGDRAVRVYPRMPKQNGPAKEMALC